MDDKTRTGASTSVRSGWLRISGGPAVAACSAVIGHRCRRLTRRSRATEIA